MTRPPPGWDETWARRGPDEVSWFQPRLVQSLRLIEASGLGPEAAIIDVGGGASTLVDDLLDRGWRDVTVLDVSAVALDHAQRRLAGRSDAVEWIAADVTDVEFEPGRYDLWHDRAAFHFLVDDADRSRYVDTLRRALKPRGQVILATFALDGPERCSGRPTVRYSPSELLEAIGPGFRLTDSLYERHGPPGGGVQGFTWVRLVRDGPRP